MQVVREHRDDLVLRVRVLTGVVTTVLDGLTLHYLVDGDSKAARAALQSFAADFAAHAQPVGGPA